MMRTLKTLKLSGTLVFGLYHIVSGAGSFEDASSDITDRMNYLKEYKTGIDQVIQQLEKGQQQPSRDTDAAIQANKFSIQSLRNHVQGVDVSLQMLQLRSTKDNYAIHHSLGGTLFYASGAAMPAAWARIMVDKNSIYILPNEDEGGDEDEQDADEHYQNEDFPVPVSINFLRTMVDSFKEALESLKAAKMNGNGSGVTIVAQVAKYLESYKLLYADLKRLDSYLLPDLPSGSQRIHDYHIKGQPIIFVDQGTEMEKELIEDENMIFAI